MQSVDINERLEPDVVYSLTHVLNASQNKGSDRRDDGGDGVDGDSVQREYRFEGIRGVDAIPAIGFQ